MSKLPKSSRLKDLPIQDALKIESRRLSDGLLENEPVVGLFADSFVVSCQGNAETVLDRAKALLRLIIEKGLNDSWPSDQDWTLILPSWFKEQCALDRTPEEYAEERKQWLSLSDDETLEQATDERWSVSEWLAWMEPSEREWIWRGSRVRNPDTLIVEIDEITDPPMGVRGDFDWLMIACGALDVDTPKGPEDFVNP